MTEALTSETRIESSQSELVQPKQLALDAVLGSQTFARADQLKCFLKYVCEMEMGGRGEELTEYKIGVEALGRPTHFSPNDDSAVRTRAFALRKKLQEYYEHEQPHATLRIELSKGSYCPHFVERQTSEPGNQGGAELDTVQSTPPLEDVPSTTATTSAQWQRNWLLPFSAGALVMGLFALGVYVWSRANVAPGVSSHVLSPIMAEAWGPLLTPNADVLLCVANPPAFSVLPGPFSPPPPQAPLTGERPLPQQLYDLYATRYPAADNLSLTVTTNATYWGDVLGALTTFKTLTTAGITPQMFPEMVTTMPTLRRHNVILFGASAYSPAVARFLAKCPLQVNYLDAVVGLATEQSLTVRYALKRDQRQRLTQVFGLITVLPGESSSEQPTRILVFSGVNSAGTQAAAEFFSSPEHLRELKQELNKAGYEAFPPAYQVVIRAETDDSIMLNFHYEAVRIIPPSAIH